MLTVDQIFFDILITVHPNITHKKWFFWHSISGIICYIVFSFCRLAISAAHFLEVFNHLQISIMIFITENIITELNKIYSPSRKLRAGNKLPMLFLKERLRMGDLLHVHKIFIEKPVMQIEIARVKIVYIEHLKFICSSGNIRISISWKVFLFLKTASQQYEHLPDITQPVTLKRGATHL